METYTLIYTNGNGDTIARDYFADKELAKAFMDNLICTYKTHNAETGLILEDSEGNVIECYEPGL